MDDDPIAGSNDSPNDSPDDRIGKSPERYASGLFACTQIFLRSDYLLSPFSNPSEAELMQ